MTSHDHLLLTRNSVKYTRNGARQVDYRGSYTHPFQPEDIDNLSRCVADRVVITNGARGRSICDEAEKVTLIIKVFVEECAILDNVGPLHQQAAGGVYAANVCRL